MVFSSPTFLFVFLPALLVAYFALNQTLRNLILLAASLFFYAWGDGRFVYLLLFSISINYGFGLAVGMLRGQSFRRWVLAICVVLNLGILGYFKYTHFFVETVNHILGLMAFPALELPAIHLPLGVSFFTFQAMSYVIDVYRRETEAERNPLNVALYIALFPQLLAGPIIRYHQIAAELVRRRVTLDGVSEGVWRFTVGLGKKAIVADTLAVYGDRVFDLSPTELGPAPARLGALCFALQLYFDFSGYSDMAVGLGRVFGFHFPENFNYPYISRSIGEYWTRWHMSLTGWFRNYLFFPLAKGSSTDRHNLGNIVLVFLLVGLWHGANWQFVLFGFIHGLLMVAEIRGLSKWLRKSPRIVGHAYCLVAIVSTLVFFRASGTVHACSFLAAMSGLYGSANLTAWIEFNPDGLLWLTLVIGIVGATPIVPYVGDWFRTNKQPPPGPAFPSRVVPTIVRLSFLMTVLFVSAFRIAGATHEAFIYFRF